MASVPVEPGTALLSKVGTVAARATTDGPRVDDDGVEFRLPDPHGRLRGVRLAQEVRVPGDQLDFAHRRGTWTLQLARPAVDRMEYLFELQGNGGGRHTEPDPANPRRAPGAFGEKSVVEFPGYVAPRWLGHAGPPGRTVDVAVRSAGLGSTVRGTLWAPEGLADDARAPLLTVHDGPEFAALGGFLDWARATVAAGDTRPFRVLLLAPGDRNRWYAAHPGYARALTADVLPTLTADVPTSHRIAVGASLGALAALHAHRLAPGTFDALFLQSGSYFTREHDPQETGFARYGPVTRFVREVAQAVADPAPVPTAMTCGAIEENLGNNRAMAAALARLDYPVRFTEVRDVHNFTAWRDALDPHLSELLQSIYRR